MLKAYHLWDSCCTRTLTTGVNKAPREHAGEQSSLSARQRQEDCTQEITFELGPEEWVGAYQIGKKKKKIKDMISRSGREVGVHLMGKKSKQGTLKRTRCSGIILETCISGCTRYFTKKLHRNYFTRFSQQFWWSMLAVFTSGRAGIQRTIFPRTKYLIDNNLMHPFT